MSLNPHAITPSLAVAAAILSSAGCAAPSGRITNPEAPGPAVGNAIGAAGGAVAGNAAGLAVGLVEGAAATAAQPFTFDPTVRTVRYWRNETTTDGRIVSIPEEYQVDAQGRVIKRLK